MFKRISLFVLFAIGIALGFMVANYSLDSRQASASGGCDRTGEYIVTSGLLEGTAGATYFLDCSTGTLTATVPNSRKKGFWGEFKANVSKDLKAFITTTKKDAFGQPLEMPTKPSYVMTTSPLYVQGKVGAYSWPAEGVSVVETQTGIQIFYCVPFNSTKFKQNTPEQAELYLYAAKQINPVMKRKQL